MIEVRQVVKRFGDILAVDGIDLSVRKGEIFGLIGHNGAGKSTLFKMMLGLESPTSGEILVDGQPPRGEAFRQVRRALGYLPENVVFYDNLTGLETLWFFADLKRANRATCPDLLAKVGLGDASRRLVRGYSKGMRQRLGFAQALLGQPKILFLDEPTNGLDPEGIREFYRILEELRAQGVTMILTSHILAEIQGRVERLAIMKMGKICAMGSLQSLREQTALPLRFRISCPDDSAEPLRLMLGQVGGAIVYEGSRGMLIVECPRMLKMEVLRVLASATKEVTDIQIEEPTLEDVFLGYGIERDQASKPNSGLSEGRQ
ncbi:MAG: ABC transporter ATP-binding protein [Betaproteobacteria bacterium]|nr:ABC transporter ATP-binding protein [Betaproteobacteria bacterium]